MIVVMWMYELHHVTYIILATISCVMSCHLKSCHVMLCYIMLYYVMSRYATSCHVTSCHVMQYSLCSNLTYHYSIRTLIPTLLLYLLLYLIGGLWWVSAPHNSPWHGDDEMWSRERLCTTRHCAICIQPTRRVWRIEIAITSIWRYYSDEDSQSETSS